MPALAINPDPTPSRMSQLYRFVIPAWTPSTPDDLPAIVSHLARAGAWFEVTPLPDAETEILLKAEHPNKTFLPPDTFVEQVERRINPLHKSRLSNARMTPDRAGVAWTDEEEALLLHHFDTGTDFKAIATFHQRTRRSIIVRLERLSRPVK